MTEANFIVTWNCEHKAVILDIVPLKVKVYLLVSLFHSILSSEQPVNVTDTFEYEEHEFWVIKTPLVETGVYRITLEFSGSLLKGILGFYYSEYTDENGQKR